MLNRNHIPIVQRQPYLHKLASDTLALSFAYFNMSIIAVTADRRLPNSGLDSFHVLENTTTPVLDNDPVTTKTTIDTEQNELPMVPDPEFVNEQFRSGGPNLCPMPATTECMTDQHPLHPATPRRSRIYRGVSEIMEKNRIRTKKYNLCYQVCHNYTAKFVPTLLGDLSN